MERPESFEPTAVSYEVMSEPAEPWMELDFAIVYQDLMTQEWARQVCGHTARHMGMGLLRSTWWKVDFLNHGKLFARAVEAAMWADVTIVSVHAAEAMPAVLSRWFEEWLAQRAEEERTRASSLVALITASQASLPEMDSTREYLRRMAERGRADFLRHERWLPDELDGFSEGISSPAPRSDFQTSLGRDARVYCDFGLDK